MRILFAITFFLIPFETHADNRDWDLKFWDFQLNQDANISLSKLRVLCGRVDRSGHIYEGKICNTKNARGLELRIRLEIMDRLIFPDKLKSIAYIYVRKQEINSAELVPFREQFKVWENNLDLSEASTEHCIVRNDLKNIEYGQKNHASLTDKVIGILMDLQLNKLGVMHPGFSCTRTITNLHKPSQKIYTYQFWTDKNKKSTNGVAILMNEDE